MRMQVRALKRIIREALSSEPDKFFEQLDITVANLKHTYSVWRNDPTAVQLFERAFAQFDLAVNELMYDQDGNPTGEM